MICFIATPIQSWQCSMLPWHRLVLHMSLFDEKISQIWDEEPRTFDQGACSDVNNKLTPLLLRCNSWYDDSCGLTSVSCGSV
jgi:hypothetical protein